MAWMTAWVMGWMKTGCEWWDLFDWTIEVQPNDSVGDGCVAVDIDMLRSPRSECCKAY